MKTPILRNELSPNRLTTLLLIGLGLAGALLAPSQATAQNWHANQLAPNADWRDYFRAFNREDFTGAEPTVSVVNNPTYSKVWRINKPVGAKRAEFSRPEINDSDYSYQNNTRYYIGFRTRFKVMNSITRQDEGIAVFQFKTQGNLQQYYPFTMDWNPKTKEHQLALHGVVGSGSVASHKVVVWRQILQEDQWTSLVIGFNYSSDPNLGWVSIWRNGVKQTLGNLESGGNYSITKWGDNKRQAFHRTKDGYNYCKWGAYNEASRKYHMRVELSDLRLTPAMSTSKPW